MPIIGPGYDDPEYDNYDPAWRDQETSFRRWLTDRFRDAETDDAAGHAALWAPANRYNGLDDTDTVTLAMLTGATVDEVRAAHKADLAEWQQEQQLRGHPELAVLDARLDHIAHRA